MKIPSFILLILIFASHTAMAETFYLEFAGETLVITGDIEVDKNESSDDLFSLITVTLKDMDIQVKSHGSESLYLQARFGWGATPLNPICKALGESLNLNVPFASGWGLVDGLPSGFFSDPTYLIMDKDKIEISKEPSGSIYYPSLYCTSREMES